MKVGKKVAGGGAVVGKKVVGGGAKVGKTVLGGGKSVGGAIINNKFLKVIGPNAVKDLNQKLVVVKN